MQSLAGYQNATCDASKPRPLQRVAGRALQDHAAENGPTQISDTGGPQTQNPGKTEYEVPTPYSTTSPLSSAGMSGLAQPSQPLNSSTLRPTENTLRRVAQHVTPHCSLYKNLWHYPMYHAVLHVASSPITPSQVQHLILPLSFVAVFDLASCLLRHVLICCNGFRDHPLQAGS